MSNDVKLPHLLSTNRTSKQGTTQPGHLVGNWVQKRSDSRYGAGHGRGQYGFEPFTPTLPSKTPGRKFQTAPTGVGIPSPPAPYRRFGRFRSKKRQHATAEPEYATRKPRRAAKPQRPRRSPATPQVRSAHPPKPHHAASTRKKSEAQTAPRIRMLDYRQKDRQFGDGRYIAQNLLRQFAALNDFSKPSSGSPSASPENMVRFKSIARTTSMVNAATMIV